MSTPESPHTPGHGTSTEIHKLNITDLERIERFRRAGYGGSVSGALARLGTLRFRHGNTVEGIALSPDGTTLYTARPGASFEPEFGAESRARHLAQGAAELDLDGIASLRQDVDTPDDLEAASFFQRSLPKMAWYRW